MLKKNHSSPGKTNQIPSTESVRASCSSSTKTINQKQTVSSFSKNMFPFLLLRRNFVVSTLEKQKRIPTPFEHSSCQNWKRRKQTTRYHKFSYRVIKGSWEAIFPVYGWLLPDEGWCEILHHIKIRSMKAGVRLYIIQQYSQWRVVWDFTSHNNTLNEGWCETWHHITIHSMKGGARLYIIQQYSQWRVVWDFTSHNNTLNEGWCETWHHITIHSMKGGVRLYITQQYMQWRVVCDFMSPNNTCNEGWCETLHHITLPSMKGAVRLYIT